MKKPYVRDGFAVVTPYLTVTNAEGLIKFIVNVFEGKIISEENRPKGDISNAIISIDESRIYISDSTSKWGDSPCALHIHVKNVDQVYNKAMKAGSQSLDEPADQGYGERSGGIKDEWGNIWWIATFKA